jgi:hypothetical protein
MKHLRWIPLSLAAALAVLIPTSLRAQDQQADPKARDLMREVYEKRQTWGPDFPGFEAKLTVLFKGQEHRGMIRVSKDYNVEVHLADDAASRWATEAMASIAGHRRATRFEEADGHYPLTFGPADNHPSGRLVRLNDGMNSTYRVRDGQILQVNRNAGPKLRFTIDIVENLLTDEGKYLPRVYTVAYFTSGSGELQRADTFWDSYRKIGKYYLPDSRRQVTAEDGSTQGMLLKLDDVKLLQ